MRHFKPSRVTIHHLFGDKSICLSPICNHSKTYIMSGNVEPNALGKPLNTKVVSCPHINFPAVLLNWSVATPGLMCLTVSTRVAPTSRLPYLMRSISSSVFRNMSIRPCLLLIGRNCSSACMARVKQPVVMPHEHMTFYLLQRINDDTNENQQ